MMKRTLFLFDVDGTLTEPRKPLTKEMKAFLSSLRDQKEFLKEPLSRSKTKVLEDRVRVGLVGGSDLEKMKEQMGEDVVLDFDYVFPENGLTAYVAGAWVETTTLRDTLPEETLQKFLKYTLRKLSELDIPCMRGTFIEFRTSMINVSPPGRNCTFQEREAFALYDAKHEIRKKMIEDWKRDLSEMPLQYALGGQISIDVFPRGWDKSYCLRFLETAFDTIYFFGDKTMEGGNDYEIFSDPRVIGYTTTGPEETRRQVQSCLECLLSS